jgi:hypothetical protein
MPSRPPSRKAARAERRADRKAARERRRRERESAGLSASLTATPDDEDPSKPNLMPVQELRRRRTFELLERTHSELVGVRERQVIALFVAAAGSDEHTRLGREVEALNDELDELRELSDELLRRIAPLDVADDRLVALEQMLGTAQALANASAKSQALLGAAQELLAAIDEALESHT